MADQQTYYPTNSNYGINLLFSGQENCAPSHTFGPAKRTNYILHYVVKGQGNYKVANKTYQVLSGNGFLIYPGDIIYYSSDPNDPWTYQWIGFDGNDCDAMLTHLGITRTNHLCRALDQNLTHQLFSQLIKSTPLDLMNPMKRTAHLTNLLASFCPKDLPLPEHNDSHIKQALDFIHNNYQYDMKISHLANTVNLERTWLYRLFQDEMGLSPKSYLTDYRLKMAKHYLSYSTLTLTEVALSCGFISASSFHKHFKKAFGITPKTYRLSTIQLK